MRRGRLAGAVAWGLAAAAAVALVVAGQRSREATREVRFRVAGWAGDAYLSPSHVHLGLWRRAEFDPFAADGWCSTADVPSALLLEWADRSGQTVLTPPSFRSVAVPLWMPVAVLVVPSIGRLVPRRTRPGVCLACGYDLRASPDRCPECGTVVSPV